MALGREVEGRADGVRGLVGHEHVGREHLHAQEQLEPPGSFLSSRTRTTAECFFYKRFENLKHPVAI